MSTVIARRRLTSARKRIEGLSFDETYNKYAPMVGIIARQIARNSGVQRHLDDLLSAGLIGLLDAFERFEPGRHVLFKTYAEWRVRGAMKDELRAQDWTPRGVRARQRNLERTRHTLEQRLQRRASDGELRDALGVNPEGFEKLLSESQPVNVVNLDDYRRLHSNPDEDPAEESARRQRREAILRATEHLTERQREVILAVYFEGLSNAETSRRLGISESRVCQVHQEALTALRRKDDLRLLLGQLYEDLAA